jgi:hypothetical protein
VWQEAKKETIISIRLAALLLFPLYFILPLKQQLRPSLFSLAFPAPSFLLNFLTFSPVGSCFKCNCRLSYYVAAEQERNSGAFPPLAAA